MNKTMTMFFAAACVVGAFAVNGASKPEAFRPPSVPIVSCDPFFSIWSPSEDPTLADTENWFGAKQPIRVAVELDGVRYRLMGAKAQLGRRDRAADVPALKCVGCEVRPLTSVFRYSDGRHEVELSFMTPKMADDLDVFTRPVTYGTVRATGAKKVRTFVEISPSLATNDDKAQMATNRLSVAGKEAISIGRVEQKPLSMKGDCVRCDWGWAYLVNPVSDGATTHFLLAYDDIAGLRFLEEDLPAWWRRGGMAFMDMLAAAEADYAGLVKKADAFDADMKRRMTDVGGEKYAQLCALAYRQSFAACQVVAAKNGHPLMFSKENTSNGSMGTVDVFYPQLPLLLLESSVLTRATLEPIMIYASSGRWPYDYAPHDVGTYPLGNGQTYGMIDSKTGAPKPDAARMPVEECGNMLICLCALAEIENSASLAEEYWECVTRWVTYLEKFGFDPGEQLCTDDFAGHLSHNANLSLKSIMAFAAYARLAERRGLKDVAAKYRKLAEESVPRWMDAAEGGAEGGYRLAFDRPGTWSQKYNLVWDRVLGFNLFPKKVVERELAAYRKLANPFGIALDNRSLYTKADWIFWSAALADSRADFDFHTRLVWRYANETPDRHPFPDWYFVNNSRVRGFLGRSVIGGVFMPAYAAKATARPSAAAFNVKDALLNMKRPATPEALETLKHSLIHRGDGKGRPDNTMEALLYTWAKGYTPESDIRYSKDGRIVAFHDNTYKKKPINAYTWEQIREWDVGSYRGAEFATCRPPLWETIFTAMEENPTRKMHIDWKDVPPEKVAELVKKHGLEKQCWFITREYDLIKRYKAALPEGQTLHWMNLGNWGHFDFNKPGECEKNEAYMMELFEKAAKENFKDIDNVQLHCQLRYDASGNVTFCPRPETMKKCIERLHAAGVEASMCVWKEEANRPETYLMLWEIGFDSFGTDYPEALYKAVDILKSKSKTL